MRIVVGLVFRRLRQGQVSAWTRAGPDRAMQQPPQVMISRGCPSSRPAAASRASILGFEGAANEAALPATPPHVEAVEVDGEAEGRPDVEADDLEEARRRGRGRWSLRAIHRRQRIETDHAIDAGQLKTPAITLGKAA